MAGDGAGERLNAVLDRAGIESVDCETAAKFETYLSLIFRWNSRLNLTSVRTEGGIISKHLAESVACARAIPQNVATLLDFGSGAGLPGIPIALCRPEIAVTLAEAQSKKAAFLQEAVRVLGTSARVFVGRAEELPATFDCVVLRAVDKMPEAVAAAAKLITPHGWLALMTTRTELPKLQEAAGAQITWDAPTRLPFGDDRILALGRRVNGPA
jgi:16S rRNA (guanine527-N7)-methyltransferase